MKKNTAVKTEPSLPPQTTTSSVPHTGNVIGSGPSMPVFSMTGSQGSDSTVSSLGSLSMPDPAGLPTPSKKLKVEHSSSSSDSSSSDSSDSESENEDPNKPSQFSNSPLPPLVASSQMPQLAGHMTNSGGHMTQQLGHMGGKQRGMGQLGQVGGHMTQSGQLIGHLPQQRPPSTSSSSSDSSDSSSGSSSDSDSSDQENDMEVVSMHVRTINYTLHMGDKCAIGTCT